MRQLFARCGMAFGITIFSCARSSAEPAVNIQNDTFNDVLCASFHQEFTQVDVTCRAWTGDINISNHAGVLLNRHHNLTCPRLADAMASLHRSDLVTIKALFALMYDNEKIAATAFKQCDANTSAKAIFNELAAFDKIDQIIDGSGGKEDSGGLTHDQADTLIDASPFSEKTKKFAQVANLLTDPDLKSNVQNLFNDMIRDPGYTLTYSIAQTLDYPLQKVLDVKNFANSFDPNQYPTSNQERQISNAANVGPKIITNYITTSFQ